MQLEQFVLDNFERYAHLEIMLDLGGLLLISGKTGYGKSRIFNGLVWCLFGVSLKKGQKPDSVVNWTIGKDCHAKLRIIEDDGIYVIDRYRKHKTYSNNLYFKLLVGDEEHDLSGISTEDTQNKINEFLGMDVKLFTNSVIFAQGFSKFFVIRNKNN